jgi:hypothetical protein
MKIAEKTKRIIANTPEIIFVKYNTKTITAIKLLKILSIEPIFFIITSPN